MMNLSTHFTLEELTASDKAVRLGIDNTPTDEALDALYTTAAGLERVRDVINAPIIVSSGYRCQKLNSSIGGARSSQHTVGEAADFKAPSFGTPLDVCKELVEHADYVDFDQLIWEGANAQGGSWVHISFSDAPRREVLTAKFSGGSAKYTKGLCDAG